MEKSVGSVDLEELKNARHELNEMRGIEDDPNMYADYNPNRDNDSEKPSSNNDESSSASESDASNQSEPKDFSVYDSFANFEVGGVQSNGTSANYEEPKKGEELNETPSNVEEPKIEETADEKKSNSSNDSKSYIDSYLDDILKDITGVSTNENETETSTETTTETTEEVTEEISDESDSDLSTENTHDNSEPKMEETESSATDNGEPEKVEVEPDKTDNDDLGELLKQGGLGDLLNDEDEKFSDATVEVQPADDNLETEEISESGDSKGLKERMNDLRKQNQISNFSEQDETKEEKIPAIERFQFVDVVSTDEFRNNGNLTFLLGRDEKNNDLYVNLKDSFNIGIFGNNENELVKLLNSMILSLMLKNSQSDFSLILCDPNNASKLNFYQDSAYMFYNRIARTQRELFDVLSDLTNEIEERYSKLAMIDAKSIDSYNEMVREDFKIPYILLCYNGYSNLASNDYYDEINVLLYNILKLGRLVGVYVVLASENPPTNSHVNYNLSTRISFKSESKDESISRLGLESSEKLSVNDEFYWANILNDKLVHAKVPELKISEAKVLLQNIENNENSENIEI